MCIRDSGETADWPRGLFDLAAEQGTDVITAEDGTVYPLGSGTLTVLQGGESELYDTDDSSAHVNNASLCTLFEAGNFRYLSTGDAESTAEQRDVYKRQEYLLTGKLYCGHCGSPMTGIAGTSKTGAMHYYYTCQKRRTDHSCDKKAVRRDQIEKAVAIAIQQQLLTDENVQMMADETMAYNARTEIKYRLQSLQQQLYSNETSTANIMKAIEMGIITDTPKAVSYTHLDVSKRQR